MIYETLKKKVTQISTVKENRTEMSGARLPNPKKTTCVSMRLKTAPTISNVIRQAVANELSKIADPENPSVKQK